MSAETELDADEAEQRLRVEYWPLDRLIPYARNARTHSAAQVAEIAGSIRAFGFSSPILIGEGGDIGSWPISGCSQAQSGHGSCSHA